MPEIFQFLIFFALGSVFSLAFWLLSKVNFSRITRYAVDFTLSLILCLIYYALNFIFSGGVLAPFSLVGVIIGLISPRLFLPYRE